MDESELAEQTPAISVELTDESEAYCLKIVFRQRDIDQPLEVYMHTTQAIDLAHELCR